MNRILKIIIPFAILGAVGYQFWPEISPSLLHLPLVEPSFSDFLPPAPCTHPIPYTLGTFDTKFNISQKYFLSALLDAEAIWEKPKGESVSKNLFQYAPADSSERVLKINLIYDYRQETTNKLASLGIVVENNQASYDSLKVKFTALQKTYDQEKSDFDVRVSAFNQENKDYEAEVQLWNGQGGAPQVEYNKLNQERLALNAESTELQTAQTNINNLADEINTLASTLNHLADSLNLSVEKYNTTSSSRGKSFDEGVYSTDGADVKEIDIYEFSSRAKLVRVLAHELGHALGLGHVEDPKSIMYAENDSGSNVLSADDLAALKARCGVK